MMGLRRRRATVAGIVVVTVVVGVVLVARHRSASSSGAGPAPTTEVPLAPGQALLTGIVSDDVSKAPIRGAQVKIDHAGGPTTVTTDRNGGYRAAVDASRPIALTIDADRYRGTVAFGKLCPGERRTLSVALRPVEPGAVPPAPIVLGPECGPTSQTSTRPPS